MKNNNKREKENEKRSKIHKYKIDTFQKAVYDWIIKYREGFTMKKRMLAMALITAMGASLLAGGGGKSSSDGTTAAAADSSAAEGSSEAASEAVSSDASGEKLVVYTNSGTDGRSEYLIEKAKEAGFDIEVVALGASEVTERMIAEKNNPLCDVTFGMNNTSTKN